MSPSTGALEKDITCLELIDACIIDRGKLVGVVHVWERWWCGATSMVG